MALSACMALLKGDFPGNLIMSEVVLAQLHKLRFLRERNPKETGLGIALGYLLELITT